MTEAELKREVLKIAYKHGWLVYHVPADTVRGSQGRGYPDLTLARNGIVLWFELKQRGKVPTEEQQAWGRALGEWYVVYPSDLDNGWVTEVLA